jgi:RNA polymerase sigma-70 factor (ECF subfamily)
MDNDGEGISRELADHRPYLCILARRNLDRRLWSLVDPSDVVQNTLLDAHRKRDQFHGNCLKKWLRTMLLNDLKDAVRKFDRIARREHSLLQAADQSSHQIDLSLQDETASPSQCADLHEDLDRLAAALARLPEAERQALELHYLHFLPCSEVAAELGRTAPAVVGLLRRGKERLRTLLHESE